VSEFHQIHFLQKRKREFFMFNVSFNPTSIRTLACAGLTSVLLAACGGGGDSTSASGASSSAGSSFAAAATTSGSSGSSTTSTGVASASESTGPFGQDASKYKQTFAQEFEGNALDTSVWNDAIWYDKPGSAKDYAVEDGSLKIWPERDASGNFVNRTIDTDGKFYQTYGYFEMEAKLPKGKGTWPAFWLLNHDAADPYRPEIDILEAYAGGGANSGWSDDNMNPTAFASTVWPNGINGGGAAGTKTFQNLGDLSSAYHKYGLKWEPNKITFYLDGREMYAVNASMSSRMYILLDLWYGSASGNPDGSTPTGKGNAYDIKYVRAWQFN
jgi:beta-glucanase (GH16 family)